MNPQLVKLLGLLAASGMVAAPIAMIADKEEPKDTNNLDMDSEEAQMSMAESEAMKDYDDSPANQDRLRQLEALRRLKNR